MRELNEILCAARYMSNELIFQISAHLVIGNIPASFFKFWVILHCKTVKIAHVEGVIRGVPRGCLIVSNIPTAQGMSIFT